MINSVSISVVTYRPDFELLQRMMESLRDAVELCASEDLVEKFSLTIIDNSTDERVRQRLDELSELVWQASPVEISLRAGDTNTGYGRAHNLSINTEESDYCLVLNPDVILDRNALRNGLSYLESNKEVAMLTPYVVDGRGERLCLCKRYPTVLDLFLRGFVPSRLRFGMSARLAHYEMRDTPVDAVNTHILIASGCFMLVRDRCMQQLRGFDERFFLYFEDFDLCLRMRELGPITYLPSAKIVHYGGEAARKGPRHIFWFLRSAYLFFNLHGWKWW